LPILRFCKVNKFGGDGKAYTVIELLLIDLTNRDYIKAVKDFVIKEKAEFFRYPRRTTFDFANKYILLGIISQGNIRRISYEECIELAKSVGLEYYEIEVKHGHNLRFTIEKTI
jgi:hypothetical protein